MRTTARPLSPLVVACIALVLLIVPAHAQSNHGIFVYMSGEMLTSYCRVFLRARQAGGMSSIQEAYDAAQCYGYVVGIVDKTSVDASTNSISSGGITATFCPSKALNANDATEVVARYLDENPEKRSIAAYFLVRQALEQAYPCRQ